MRKATDIDVDEERPMALVDALEDQLTTYDETLYYVAKDYVATHHLYNKQHKRAVDVDSFPTRYQLLQIWKQPLQSRLGICYFLLQCLLVIATIVQLMYESAPAYSTEVDPQYRSLWVAIELPIAAAFTLDLMIHFALLPPEPNDFSRNSRRGFFKKAETWLDILTIVPSIFTLLEEQTSIGRNLGFLKAVRVLRFTRVVRQFHAIDQLAHTLERCFEPLIGPFIFIGAVSLTLASAIYFSEKGEYDPLRGQFMIDDCDCLMSAPRAADPNYPCPKVVSQFRSIPHTIWFTVITITTVGYGDTIPRCNTGRILVTITMFLGNVLTAMPIAIVGTYYTNIVMANRQRMKGEANKKAAEEIRNRKNEHNVRQVGDGMSIHTGGGESSRRNRGDAVEGRSATTGDDEVLLGEDGEGEGGGAYDPSATAAVAGRTAGERLANHMFHNDIVFDALKPPSVVVHKLNAIIKREFDAVIEQLVSKQGQARLKEASASARGPMSLEQVSAPPVAMLPKHVSLTKPLQFVFGYRTPSAMASHSDLYCSKDATKCAGLPAQLFHLTFCPVRHHVTILPIFPAHIAVNEKDLGYTTPTKLLIGDIITIVRDPSIGEPISYQFIKMGGNMASNNNGNAGSGAAGPSSFSPTTSSTKKKRRVGGAAADDDVAANIVGASIGEVRTLPPVDGSPVIEITPVPPQREHRNLQLSAYVPTFESLNHSAAATGQVQRDPFDMSDL